MKKKLLLTVTNLSCKRNYINIFNPLFFKLSEGQLLIIKGKNGKGKTTLLHCLAGILPYEGSIKWQQKFDKIGYVGHKFGLKENETVIDFISFWKEVYNSKICIKETVNFFSISKLLFSPIAFLSYGQKKKLTFVRLFLLNSKVWLLDEPFSGMDEQNRKLIYNMIKSHINKKGIVILSTHEKAKVFNIKNKRELIIG